MSAPRTKSTVQEKFVFTYTHADCAADKTTQIWKVPTGRNFTIDRVLYVNPTGLAAHASNYFTIKILNAALVVSSWSTLTGSDGTLTADTLVVPTITAANILVPSATVVSLFLDLTGTQTLPAGTITVEGRLL